MRSHIGWRGERCILYKAVEFSLYQTRFKTLRGSLKGKAQRGQYLLALDFGCTLYDVTLPAKINVVSLVILRIYNNNSDTNGKLPSARSNTTARCYSTSSRSTKGSI